MEDQTSIKQQLWAAVQATDLSAVESIISNNPNLDIDCRHTFGQTALHKASQFGSWPLVRYLVNKGADTQAVDCHGATAAHLTCWRKESSDSLAILQLLIKNDQSLLNKCDEFEDTCLHLAAANGNVSSVQWLLNAGASATLLNNRGETAWDSNVNKMISRFSRFESKYFEGLLQTYRLFVREEMKLGNMKDRLDRINYKRVGSLDMYQLSNVNVADLYMFLEYLTYLAPLRQACQQMRKEICSSIVMTGNKQVYREPSCTLETGNHDYDGTQATALESVCSESTYKNFNALVSIQRTVDRPKVAKFETSELLCRANTAGNQESSPESIDGNPSPTPRSHQQTLGCPKTTKRMPRYLSLVMPFISRAKVDRLFSNRDRRADKYRYDAHKRADLTEFSGCLTLDEYSFPALSKGALERRNPDQTLTKFHKLLGCREARKSGGQRQNARELRSDMRHDLVVVDQVWIWLTQDVLIYTSLSGDYRFEDDPNGDISSTVYVQVGQSLVNFMDTGDSDYIFDEFQSFIVMLAEDVSSYIDQGGVESMTIQKEKEFYHNINDVREELSMLQRLLTQQEEVWGKFVSNVWPEIWVDYQNGRTRPPSDLPQGMSVEDQKTLRKLIMRPQLRIQKSRRRISQLDEDAERVERSIAIQLDLKQKHASLKEAHATAVMSTAVFGFTIITIIFTPLSFFVSLFALPIDRLQDNQVPSRWTNDAGMYSTNYFGKWIATAEITSIALTIIAMWLALEYGLKYRVTLKVFNFFKNQSQELHDTHQELSQKIKSFKSRWRSSQKSQDEGLKSRRTSLQSPGGEESV